MALLLRTARRPVLRAIPRDTAAVVSTYPGASQVLGALRRRGELAVPAVTYLTDFSVHALWVAPGIDVHLAAHQVPARQAAARDAAGVRVCAPVVGKEFGPATAAERRAARAVFGLPADGPLALLVAGSWGVGAVERAAAELRDVAAVEPVVVCGRNERLAGRLRAQGFAHVHGWVDDMPRLMRACDVLVHLRHRLLAQHPLRTPSSPRHLRAARPGSWPAARPPWPAPVRLARRPRSPAVDRVRFR